MIDLSLEANSLSEENDDKVENFVLHLPNQTDIHSIPQMITTLLVCEGHVKKGKIELSQFKLTGVRIEKKEEIINVSLFLSTLNAENGSIFLGASHIYHGESVKFITFINSDKCKQISTRVFVSNKSKEMKCSGGSHDNCLYSTDQDLKISEKCLPYFFVATACGDHFRFPEEGLLNTCESSGKDFLPHKKGRTLLQNNPTVYNMNVTFNITTNISITTFSASQFLNALVLFWNIEAFRVTIDSYASPNNIPVVVTLSVAGNVSDPGYSYLNRLISSFNSGDPALINAQNSGVGTILLINGVPAVTPTPSPSNGGGLSPTVIAVLIGGGLGILAILLVILVIIYCLKKRSSSGIGGGGDSKYVPLEDPYSIPMTTQPPSYSQSFNQTAYVPPQVDRISIGLAGPFEYVALADYHAAAENQLSLAPGDVVLVDKEALNNITNGWLLVTMKKTGRQGYVPSTYVAPYEEFDN